MSLEELRTVRKYLQDYSHTHALTEEEIHCIRKLLRNISREEHNILVETGVLIRTRMVIEKFSDGHTEKRFVEF